MAYEIAHVEIGVRDLDRSLEFYSGLLGFTSTEGNAGGHRVAELGGGPAGCS